MKAGTENLIKFKHLKSLLGRPDYATRGVLCALWSITRLNCPEGDIGRFDNLWIATAIEWDGDPDHLILSLYDSRWIDSHPLHRFVIHDWPDHCEDSVHMKLARKKMWFADGTAPNLRRLSQKEKMDIGDFYTSTKPPMCAHQAHDKRMTSAHQAHVVRTTMPLPMPMPMPMPVPMPLPVPDTSSAKSAGADCDGSDIPERPKTPQRPDPLAEYPHIAERWEALTTGLNSAKPAAKPPKEGSKDWFAWRDTLAKLVRIDGFTEEQVCQTIRWAIHDTSKQASFWRESFYSFAPLRSKTKSGVSKFQMMFDQKNPSAGFSKSLEDQLEESLHH